MSKFRRQLMMASMGEPVPPLPYDAEVEYLETDGYAYIDLPYTPNSNTLAYVTYMPISDSVALSTSYSPFCGRVGYQNKNFGFAAPVNNASYIQFYLGNSSTQFTISNLLGNKHVVSVNQASNKAYIDNSAKTVNGSGSFTYTIPLRLFRANTNNDTPTTLNHKMRIYYFRIKENGEILYEFIPVRKNGVGYLYDKTNGVLYGNSSSVGELSYGNDVTE